MALQLLHPVLCDLLVSPARPQRFVGLPGGFAKRGSLDLTFRAQRIAAAPGDCTVLLGGLAPLCERHVAASAEPDVVAFAVDGEALDPMFGPAGRL